MHESCVLSFPIQGNSGINYENKELTSIRIQELTGYTLLGRGFIGNDLVIQKESNYGNYLN
jgi:hypothetical protein